MSNTDNIMNDNTMHTLREEFAHLDRFSTSNENMSDVENSSSSSSGDFCVIPHGVDGGPASDNNNRPYLGFFEGPEKNP